MNRSNIAKFWVMVSFVTSSFLWAQVSSDNPSAFPGESPKSPSVENSAPATSPMASAREAKVTCLAVNSVTFEGSTHPITVRVSPNPSGETSVGVLEEFSSGTGDQWRTAAWIAAFSASKATDSLINEHEFLLRTSGHIDGPSAGMLITATMVALIRGDAVLADVAMTGTINPDGSAGPVGGIPNKLEAAAKAGIKRFGYPTGQRIARDEKASPKNDTVVVDLKEKAKELRVEAVEIGDLFDAYKLLTGKDLPRPMAISEDQMEISIPLAQRVRGASQFLRSAAKQRLDTLERKSEALSGSAKALQKAELKSLAEIIVKSRNYEEEGSITLGYYYAGFADQQSRISELKFEMDQHGARGDIKNFEQVGKDQYDATFERLEALRKNLKASVERVTVGGRVDAIHSYINYWQGRAVLDAGRTTYMFALAARKQLETIRAGGKKGADSNASERDKAAAAYFSLVNQMTVKFATAQSMGDSAANWANFAVDSGPNVAVPPDLYKKLGMAYSVAAGAGMKWFESIIVKPKATAQNASAEAINVELILEEPDYSPILSATRFAEGSAGNKVGESLLPLDQLASGLYAFHGLASLINKRYNFSGSFSNVDPQNVQLSNRKALGHTLDLARQRVLEECLRVQTEIGFVPDSIKLNYDLANVLRDGPDLHKLIALKAYWRCNFLCDIARRLAKTVVPSSNTR